MRIPETPVVTPSVISFTFLSTSSFAILSFEAKMKRLLSNVGTSKKQYERAERHSLMYG